MSIDKVTQVKRPRRDCKSVKVWRAYYAAQAEGYAKAAETFDYFPVARQYVLDEAARFRSRVAELDAGRHPLQVSGEWR